ncbi:MAG: hypothetical protein FWD96_06725 [Defluviitaleaceae bacterium]|nr:hypothetical protein [Defluviitaleaceae bacterium]
MKKYLSSMLAGVMVFSMATPVAASTSDRERFMAALDTTYTQLARESAIMHGYVFDQFAIMNGLSEAAYEMSIDLSANFMGQDIGLTQLMRADEPANRFSMNMEIFGLDALFFEPDISLSMYTNNDRTAMSADTGRYFYLPNNMTAASWAETELGQAGISFDEVASVFLAAQLIQTQSFGSMNFANFELPEGFFDQYKEIWNSHLANARFRSQGEHLVPAQRGNIRTERITATMNANQVAACLSELAYALENDTVLRAYLIGMFPQIEGVQPGEVAALVGAGISGAALALRSLADEFSGTVEFSVYVATNGIAVRQALNIALNDIFGTSMLLNFDLLGSDFMVNEMGLSLSAGALGQYATFDFSMIGNNIMQGGIQETAMVLRAQFGDMFGEFRSDSVWDSNIAEDNYRADMAFEMYAPALGIDDVLTITALMEGSYFQSVERSTIVMDTIITGSWGELLGDPDASAKFAVALRPISPNFVGIRGTGINVAEISADDEALILEFFQIFE